ncbi:MAG: flagellar biosynthesis protein FlhB [Phycisphaerales bacterium]|nr:flagellar biosynthesis protein FlhB [Phycisphaerales bacterium]
MAEEDYGDRTEDPTPRRREEAREEGRVARSADLTAAVSLLAAVLLLRFLGPDMMAGLHALTASLHGAGEVSTGELAPLYWRTLELAARLTLPFLALLLALTAAGAAVQTGLRLTWKKLTPKPEHLSPIKGLKRVVSTESLTRLMISLVKLTIVTLVCWHTIAAGLPRIVGSGAGGPGGFFVTCAGVLFDLAVRLALVLLILGLIDYMFQRWRTEKQLRMTKQEVRDELKRMEGDPLIKQRRRQVQQRLALQRMRAEVPRAQVVVTNPTEYAVALRYDEQRMSAPRVTAKGRGYLAHRIRQLALEHGVPVVQRPPLARALYAAVDVGREVPPAFYRAVAEVLAYVYQLARRAG